MKDGQCEHSDSGVGGDLRSAITDPCTRLSLLWRGLQGVAGGSVLNPRVMGGGGLIIYDQHYFIGAPPQDFPRHRMTPVCVGNNS